MGNKKLSTEPYKGTRDFYPEDQSQNYIFNVWRKVAESFGYLEYGASILEETALYKAKSGEEIVNEQTYSFTDRGGRDVTIRPEMTPTVARMVAQKRKELTFPLRWFSIPNLFRYERPQRGRLREHWQLNCDIFGVDSIEADVEIINLAYNIMKAFGAKDENFQIRINSRKVLNSWSNEVLNLPIDKTYKLTRLIDKKDKISNEEFVSRMEEIIGNKEQTKEFASFLNSTEFKEQAQQHKYNDSIQQINQVINKVRASGINNLIEWPSLARGFDYYTSTVFEVYDTSKENPRALFGGGRYDDLVGIFGVEKVSGVGFGMGDVTMRDYLETYKILPEYKSEVDLYICHLEGFMDAANQLASDLRKEGVAVAVDLTDKKVSSQVKTADKQKIPFVIVVGEEEIKSGQFKVKNLKASKEETVAREQLANFIKKR